MRQSWKEIPVVASNDYAMVLAVLKSQPPEPAYYSQSPNQMGKVFYTGPDLTVQALPTLPNKSFVIHTALPMWMTHICRCERGGMPGGVPAAVNRTNTAPHNTFHIIKVGTETFLRTMERYELGVPSQKEYASGKTRYGKAQRSEGLWGMKVTWLSKVQDDFDIAEALALKTAEKVLEKFPPVTPSALLQFHKCAVKVDKSTRLVSHILCGLKTVTKKPKKNAAKKYLKVAK